MFFVRLHFTKGYIKAIGDKNRIITKAFITTRRPNQITVHPALKGLDMPVRPSQRQRTEKVRMAIAVADLINDLFAF